MSALDALDGIGQLDDLSVLKEKILFSVVVVGEHTPIATIKVFNSSYLNFCIIAVF